MASLPRGRFASALGGQERLISLRSGFSRRIAWRETLTGWPPLHGARQRHRQARGARRDQGRARSAMTYRPA